MRQPTAPRNKAEGGFLFASPELQASLESQLALERELAGASDRGELVVHYQPRFRLRTPGIAGVEALVRWQHPKRGLLLPAEFIRLAEDSGLIIRVDQEVLRLACVQAKTWQQKGYNLTVAVNLSARHFLREDLVDTITRVLKETGLAPSSLELEITETAAVKSPERTRSMLAELRARGIGIAVDDFGTGYGSLHYLKQFPVNTLKIDRSFVSGLPTNRQDAAIAAAVIALAKNLGCTVVAEGVETPPQLAWLQRLGCDEVQGFLLCRPVPAPELEPLLENAGSEVLGSILHNR
ncbi:MAG: putative bifunctional diguanylate cyclase/phosphodiesterase [Moorellales bacterium]